MQGKYHTWDLYERLMSMSCDCDDEYDYYDDCISYISPKANKMNKDYMTGRGNSYDTEQEAIDDASRYVTKNSVDVKIYKAYKIVSPLTPNIKVTDIV